jgi:septal ring factor EnvC (AmiA/AmiB activator)
VKIKVLIGLLALALLTVAAATGCSSSGVTTEQVMALQNQVNSLSNSLNSNQQQLASTQQQLATTQQQLVSAQQSLSQSQSQVQQQKTYVTYAQPVYQPTVIYRAYPYGTPWYQYPVPSRPPQPFPTPLPPMP